MLPYPTAIGIIRIMEKGHDLAAIGRPGKGSGVIIKGAAKFFSPAQGLADFFF